MAGSAVHVLVVDHSDVRASRLVDELEGRGRIRGDTCGSAEAALDRLAWPDIDCLLVRHDTETADAIETAEEICATHPCLPVVLYTTAREGSVAARAVGTAVDEFVDGSDDGGYDRLVETIESVALDREDGDVFPPSDVDTDPRPNVDPETVDELLASGIERDHLAELLHKSALFDSLLESLPIHLYVKDSYGRHLHASRGDRELSAGQFRGRTDPEARPVADRHARRAYREDRSVVDSGEPIVDKIEYLPMRGQWNLTSKVPWYGPDGDVVGLLGVTRDISDHKARQDQLRRQNERLEQFVEMVSHDLRNPLQAATMRLELAVSSEDPAPHLDDLDTCIQRIDRLIEDVLALARRGNSVVSPAPVSVAEAAGTAQAAIDAPELSVEIDADPGTVLGDEGRLRELFANLFGAAIGDGGREVTVRIGGLADGFYVETDGADLPVQRSLSESESPPVEEAFGLPTVVEIARSHGWEISSSGPDRLSVTGVDGADDEPLDGAAEPSDG